MNARFHAAIAIAMVLIAPFAVFAQTPSPKPVHTAAPKPILYRCYPDRARATYDKKRDRVIVRYAGERIVLARVPSPSGMRFVNLKKHLEWREVDGKATFSHLLPDNVTTDNQIATCVYRR